MQIFFDITKVISISVISALRTAIKRALHGPSMPSWNLGLEIAVNATKDIIHEVSYWPPERMQSLTTIGMPAQSFSQTTRSRCNINGVHVEKTILFDKDAPIILYLHGGGTVLGSPISHRNLITQLAKATKANVYAPFYRLAPQHPFPASFDDIFQCYSGLIEKGYAPENIVIAGDSAGAFKSFSLMHKIVEANLPIPAALFAICPTPDLTCPGDSWDRHSNSDYLSKEVFEHWVSQYSSYEQRNKNKFVSVIHGDFDNFPPVLIHVGGAECLYDDVCALHHKLSAAGVDVEMECFDEMPHVWHFFRLFTTEADRSFHSASTFLNAKLSQGKTNINSSRQF